MSTLLFANRAKNMKNKAIINEDTTGDLKRMEYECKKLKEENVELRSKLMKGNYKLEFNKTCQDNNKFDILKSVIDH